MAEITGRSFTDCTVTVKFVTDRPKDESDAVRVITDEPNWLVEGVTVMVRLAPFPTSTTPLAGTTLVLPETAVTVTWLGEPSGSLTVNGIGPLEVSSSITTLVNPVTTGF